jgi:hypothetical protein
MVRPNAPLSSECWRWVAKPDWHVVNLRPVLVYGSGMKGNLARMITADRSSKALPLLPETGQPPLAGACGRCGTSHAAEPLPLRPPLAGPIWSVTDKPIPAGNCMLMAAGRLGDPYRAGSVPASVLYGSEQSG